MTTEEKAKAYAENADYPTPENGWYDSDHEDMEDVLEQAYLAGATEALASQWKDPEVELPEDDSVVLAKIAETANEHEFIRYTVARYTDGCWIFQDGYFEDCMVSHWLRIPALPDGKEGEV